MLATCPSLHPTTSHPPFLPVTPKRLVVRRPQRRQTFPWCYNVLERFVRLTRRSHVLSARNVLNQEEGRLCHLPTEVKDGGKGLEGGGGRTHISTWETDSSDILNCCHTNSPVTLLPVTAEECGRWDYFKLPTGTKAKRTGEEGGRREEGGFLLRSLFTFGNQLVCFQPKGACY